MIKREGVKLETEHVICALTGPLEDEDGGIVEKLPFNI